MKKLSLISILKEVVEANLSKDASKDSIAKDYIKKIHDLINSYKKDTREIKVKGLGNLSFIEINLNDITVNIIPTKHGAVKAQFEPAKNGKKPQIDVYSAEIEHDPKLSAKFDEKDLYHELIHFLDFTKIKTSPDKLDKSYQKERDKKGYEGYINNPLEVNAHFFEYFMPEVVKYIEKKNKVPDTFNEFKDELFRLPKTKDFYNDLNDDNKRRILKRLGIYYDNILNNPDLEIQKPDNKVDTSKLKRFTDSFLSKLRSAVHFTK